MINKKRIFKTLAIFAATFIAVILIVAIAIRIILTPDNLNNMVSSYSREYLNANVKTDTIELHIFKNFPRITLSVKNGVIVSKALDSLRNSSIYTIPAKADTLLKFKSFDISLSLLGLLSSDVTIRKANIVSPQIYLYTAPDGSTNYNIFKDNGSEQESADGQESSSLSISMNDLGISEGGNITYNSLKDSLAAKISLNSLVFKGNLTTSIEDILFRKANISNFKIGIDQIATNSDTLQRSSAIFTLDSLDIASHGKGRFTVEALTRSDLKINDASLAKDFPFEINGGIIFDTTQALKGSLEDFKIIVAKVPVVFNGDFNITPDSLYTNNICGKVENFKVSEMLQYIPPQIFKDIDKVKSNAVISADVDVNGSYNFKTGKMPSVVALLDIPQSYVEFEGRASRINEIETHIKAYYSAVNKDSAAIEVNKFVVNGRGLQLALNGKISDLASSDPYVDMQFKGSAFLDTLSTLFPAKSGSVFTGDINAELSVKSRASKLNMYNIGNADIKGAITTDSTKIFIPQEDFYAMFSGIRIGVGAVSNTADASIKKGTKMLATNTTADSVYFKYKDIVKIAAANFRLAGHQAANILKRDTATRRVHPLNGVISAKILNVRGTDSAALRMRDPKINFSILPYKEDYSVPVLKVSTQARRLMARDMLNRASIGNGNITIEAVLNNTANRERKVRMERLLDSLQNVYPQIERDSLIAYHIAKRMANREHTAKNDFAGEDFDFKVDKSIGELIRRWNITGLISAQSGRITTPYFPLKTRMQNINFNFTTDKIEFKDTKITAGQSQFALTGKAEGLRRAMLRNGIIDINGSIVSDTLNLNELITAANSGMEFMDTEASYRDSLSKIADEDKLAEALAVADSDTTATVSSLIIVPGNIKADLKLDVKYGIYSKLKLQKIAGELIIKDRCMQITDFEALTTAGNMSLTAFYATRSKDDLATGFDLDIKDMAIERLIEIMPAVDTLLPMLKSFEGVVNCQVAATSKIDTAMNIILPTLRGVARIKGENLVLMDGETFSTIAKKLKFKNREKNYIDKISVELLLNDNKIEVFPFIAEMDRYKFAISGTQNLDMSFLYSISILQSPLPFRVGVKIFGNADDFHFKIGRAQYKSENLPVFSTVIDSARINLREQIANIYRIGIDAALKNNGNIDDIQKKKENHDIVYVEKMDSLSKEEETQLEMITPAPTPSENEPLTPKETEPLTETDTPLPTETPE